MTLALFVSLLFPAADDPLASKALPKLFKVVDLSVERQPVGKFVKAFAAEHGVEIVVDGRVDLSAPVIGRFKKSGVERILGDAARYANARMALVGEVVYIAPQESADRVAAAAAKSRKLLEDFDLPAAWKEKRSKKWTEEATVKELVAALAKDLGVEVKDADELDVKVAAGALKNVQAADMLSVWAALADHTWSLDKEGARLTFPPLPEDARMKRSLRAASVKEAIRRAGNYRGLKDEVLSVDVKGQMITLAGPFSALWAAERLDREEAIAVANAKTQKPGKTKSAKRYSPTFKNTPLSDFAARIADHVKKSVEIDEVSLEKAGKSKELKIDCVATGVELEELLELALEPHGLTFTIDGDKIVISAAK
jgi:type II secretory pathway component GspD/PulD (secretin)